MNNPYPLPAWFEENRVQANTRLTPRRLAGTAAFDEAASTFRALGVRVFVRHVKSGPETPRWTNVGVEGHRPGMPQMIKQMVQSAHSQGMRMIAYYWIMAEDEVAQRHPEWVCQLEDDSPAASKRGLQLDLTTPYRELVLQRLLELAAAGVDGFLFDNRHIVPEGCRGTNLERAFRDATGHSLRPGMRRTDPIYRSFMDFQAVQIEETFLYWRDEVKQRYPEVVFIISTTTVPRLDDPEMKTSLAEIADSPKNEFVHALRADYFRKERTIAAPEDDIRMALGWTLLRDSAEGRPPHIWSPGFPDADHALGFVGAMLTYGSIANLDVPEELLTDLSAPGYAGVREALQQCFSVSEVVSPYLAGTRPLRWAAVHFSESARDQRGSNMEAIWREIIWPVAAAFGTLTRERVPVGIVNDQQLEQQQLEGYEILFLAAPDELTPGQQQSVADFVARGGTVIRNDPLWMWGQEDGHDAAAASLSQVTKEHLATAPVQVLGGPQKAHAVAYEVSDGSRLVIAITNEFDWVQLSPKWNMEQPLASIHAAPPPVEGMEIVVRSKNIPIRSFDALSGLSLPVEAVDGGFKLRVPDFRTFSLVVIEMEVLPRRASGPRVPADHFKREQENKI